MARQDSRNVIPPAGSSESVLDARSHVSSRSKDQGGASAIGCSTSLGGSLKKKKHLFFWCYFWWIRYKFYRVQILRIIWLECKSDRLSFTRKKSYSQCLSWSCCRSRTTDLLLPTTKKLSLKLISARNYTPSPDSACFESHSKHCSVVMVLFSLLFLSPQPFQRISGADLKPQKRSINLTRAARFWANQPGWPEPWSEHAPRALFELIVQESSSARINGILAVHRNWTRKWPPRSILWAHKPRRGNGNGGFCLDFCLVFFRK